MAVDEQAFLHHALTIDEIRVRAVELAPCGDPDCGCAERINPVYYFAKPHSEYDEWLYCLEADVGMLEEADATAEDTLGDVAGNPRLNLDVLAALVGAPWEMIREDPARVVVAQRKTVRMLGNGGCDTLREMGPIKVREMFGLARELWQETMEDEPR